VSVNGKVFIAILTVYGLVSLVFFLVFDSGVTSSGSESVKAWLKGEETSIIQGNLLTSVTKTQKILLASEFIKGIVIYDIADGDGRVLMEFGEKPGLPTVGDASPFRISGTGFLAKEIFVTIPQRSDLLIGFTIRSERLVGVFWLTNLVVAALIAMFSFVLLRVKKREQQAVALYAKKAAEVAHDLAQPLLALNALSLEVHESSEMVRTLKAVIGRITNIVDDLGMGNKGRVEFSHEAGIEAKIRSLIEEKRTRIGNRVIDIEMIVSASLEPLQDSERQFLRTLSNLLDNSLEAIRYSGRICISFEETAHGLKVVVEDTGRGIPEDILPQIGNEGFSHGKKNGNGLGVASAREYAESAGGEIKISSVVGVGTAVSLWLPDYRRQQPAPLLLTSDTENFRIVVGSINLRVDVLYS